MVVQGQGRGHGVSALEALLDGPMPSITSGGFRSRGRRVSSSRDGWVVVISAYHMYVLAQEWTMWMLILDG